MKELFLFFSLIVGIYSLNAQQSNVEISNISLTHNTFSFMENKGQWDQDVLFKSTFKGGNLWIQKNKFLFHLQDYKQLESNHKSDYSNPKQTNNNHLLYLFFKNSLPVEKTTQEFPSSEYYNFFIGKDRTKWASDIHTYSKVTLHEIYKGIAIRLYQEDEQIKYEFVVQQHIDPKIIQLEIRGATSTFIDREGKLHLKTPLGEIIEKKPFVYQIIEGEKKEINSEFQIHEDLITFKVGQYDSTKELIIDPILVFATYNGALSSNFGQTATYGNDGTVYSGGMLFGSGYPTIDPNVVFTSPQLTSVNYNSYVPSDVFISKYSADGSKMLWSTFMGGGDDLQGAESLSSIICDKQNNIYGFGATSSTNFPVTTNCYQSQHKGGTKINIFWGGTTFGDFGTDLFAFKISADGHQLLGSTYIGGSKNDGLNYNYMGQSVDYTSNIKYPNPIAGDSILYVPYDSLVVNYGDSFRGEIFLDSVNNIIIASSTRSTDFPINHAIQPILAGKQDGLLLKLKNDFSNLLFSTYIGGSNNDVINSVKLTTTSDIIFCGGTSSIDLKTTSKAYKTNYGGGKADGFIGKLSLNGNILKQLTYIGQNSYDQAMLIESDAEQNIYVVGQSLGGKFPVTNVTYSIPYSSQFIAKFDSSLTKILNSTVYGNGDSTVTNISPTGFLVDDCKNIYVCGWGANIFQNGVPYYSGIGPSNLYQLPGNKSYNMPVSNDALKKTTIDGYDFHLFVIDQKFSKLIYGSYLGGPQSREHVHGGTSRFDKKGIVYQSVCGGCGGYSDFPVTPNAWSKTNNSNNCNNVIFKYDFQLVPTATITASQDTSCLPAKITYTNTSNNINGFVWDFGNGSKDSTSQNPTKTYLKKGSYNVKLIVKNDICHLSDTVNITTNVLDTIHYTRINDLEFCDTTTTKFIANSYGTANQYTWSFHNNFFPILKKSSDSTFTFKADTSQWIYYQISNGYCPKTDSVSIAVISPTFKIFGDNNICVQQTDSIYCTIQSAKQTFTFDWSPKQFIQSYPSLNSALVKIDTTQTIFIKAQGNQGCIITDSMQINLVGLNLLNTLASANKTKVIKGDNVQLFGKPDGFSYLWTPEDKVLASHSQNTEATIWDNTIFTLKVMDGPCAASDTILIKVIPWNCDFPYVFVPNAFSPNGDGENDVLYVRGHPIKTIEFRVFNRWGELVFESHDINQGWDGIFKGKLVDPDVFDYYLNVTCVDEEHKQIQGNITVLR